MFGSSNDIRKKTEKENTNEPCYGGSGGRLSYELFCKKRPAGKIARHLPRIATALLLLVLFGGLGTVCGIMMFQMFDGSAIQYSGMDSDDSIGGGSPLFGSEKGGLSSLSFGGFDSKVISVTADHAKRYRVPMGVLIHELSENCVGYAAGVRSGDIVVMIDGIEIEKAEELFSVADKYESGKTVLVKVFRDGEYRDFLVTVE